MSALRALRTLRPSSTTPRRLFFSTTPAPHAMARMTLIGHLTATPEAQQTASGKTLFRYTVAVNAAGRDAEASFYNVAAFFEPGDEESPRARLLAGLPKGTLCYVEADGRMATLEPREGEERGRKVLNLTQKTFQVLSPKASSA